MGCSQRVFRRNCIALNAYIEKEETSQVSNLNIYLKILEKKKRKLKLSKKEENDKSGN